MITMAIRAMTAICIYVLFNSWESGMDQRYTDQPSPLLQAAHPVGGLRLIGEKGKMKFFHVVTACELCPTDNLHEA